MESENRLIEKAASGDEQAFSILIDNYKNYVFAIILNFIKDYNDVENIAQEVFFQVYISLSKYNHNNFKAWIGRITTNKSIDWLRKKKSRSDDESLDELADRIYDTQNINPEIQLIEKDKKERLAKALNSVPDIYRTSLEKFYFQGKSYENIAEEEQVTAKTVASRLYRAKILLREKWRNEDEAL